MGILESLPALTVPDHSGSVVLTLSNPSGTDIESLTVPATFAMIAGAIIRYANAHGISPASVSLAVLWE